MMIIIRRGDDSTPVLPKEAGDLDDEVSADDLEFRVSCYFGGVVEGDGEFPFDGQVELVWCEDVAEVVELGFCCFADEDMDVIFLRWGGGGSAC